LRNNCVRTNNDDLKVLMTISASVQNVEHGIEGGRAIRDCGRRHSTLVIAIGVSDPV